MRSKIPKQRKRRATDENDENAEREETLSSVLLLQRNERRCEDARLRESLFFSLSVLFSLRVCVFCRARL